jgi:hypothetical protein
MKIVRVVTAIVITLGMLYIARSNSRGRPEYFAHTEGQISFEMTSVPKIIEFASDTVTVRVTGPADRQFQVLFRTSQPDNVAADQPGAFTALPMNLKPGTDDLYYTVATAGKKGGRFHYYYEVVDSTGTPFAAFYQPDGSPFYLRFIGEVPPVVFILHLVFIFATVYTVAMTTVHAVGVIWGRDSVRTMMKYLLWSTIFCFIGGYPLGLPMNYYAFTGDWATSWEGVPFGTDATDNKTQLLFAYLVFASLAGWGSLRNRAGADLFGPRTLGWIGLGSFAVMLFIYLIPHSIQFSAGLTYGFCYSWIGLLALVYVVAYLRRPSTR